MSNNDAKQPLIPQPLDINPSTATRSSKYGAPKRKAFRRCKSAPLADLSPLDNIKIAPPNQTRSSRAFCGSNLFKVIALLAVYLGIATIAFYVARDHLVGAKTNGVLDAVYFSIVTMTTVGYGDLVPSSDASKLLACALVFSGMAIVCLILSKAADYLVEKQEFLLVKALHSQRKLAYTEILREAEINRTRYKCILVFVGLVILIGIGTFFLWKVEELGVIDSFYCVCSTITTLGYGDKSFKSKWGRVFASMWILISTIMLAQFFLYVAELNTENRQKKLVNWVLTRRVTNVDLEAADLDEDGNVGAAEFVLYKLKEMGKITQDDISLIMEEFEELDVDQSGTLSPSDIFLAQSTQTVPPR